MLIFVFVQQNIIKEIRVCLNKGQILAPSRHRALLGYHLVLLKLKKAGQQRGGFAGKKKTPTNEDHISIMKVYPFINIFKVMFL